MMQALVQRKGPAWRLLRGGRPHQALHLHTGRRLVSTRMSGEWRRNEARAREQDIKELRARQDLADQPSAACASPLVASGFPFLAAWAGRMCCLLCGLQDLSRPVPSPCAPSAFFGAVVDSTRRSAWCEQDQEPGANYIRSCASCHDEL